MKNEPYEDIIQDSEDSTILHLHFSKCISDFEVSRISLQVQANNLQEAKEALTFLLQKQKELS